MIFEKILSIFLIMALGFTVRKVKAVDGAFTKSLSKFLINIALPFALLTSLDRSIPKSVLPDLGMMLLWAAAVHVAAVLFSTFAYRGLPPERRKILSFTTVFTNSAFMGLPLAHSVGGAKGMMFGAMYNLVYGVLFYTYGFSLFTGSAGSGQWKKIILNPGIIATAVGLVLWFLPFSMPAFFLEATGLMAKLQTPLAMFVVGAAIADIGIGIISAPKELAAAVAVRLVLVPLAVFGVIAASGAKGMAPAVTLLMSAMPAGAQTVVITEMMGGDSTLASEIVLVTTALSILTIPVFAGFVAWG